MSKMNLSSKYNSGLSLIELMVAMVIGLILIGGTASVYLASKQSYVEVERMARMTQNSRFALQMISDSLIHAGYSGELPLGSIEADASLSAIGADCTGTAAGYDLTNYLIATTSNGSGEAMGCITDALPNTLVLMVKNVRPLRLTPADIVATNTYVVANNIRGILFDGADTAPTITIGGDVPNGNVWIYEAQIYYIRDKGTAVPQLTRRVLVNGAFVTEELVEGVENISFLFGRDSDGDGNVDVYQNAAAIADWSSIAAVEVNILVRSNTIDPQYTDNKTYNLGDLAPIVAPGDKYHRMVMQSTVSLRNPKFVIRGTL